MATSTGSRAPQSGVGHADLERRFTELVDDIRSARWHAVDASWPELAAEFEGHFVFEERDLFRRYCADEPAKRSLVRRLVAEHMRLREQIATLGERIAAREVTAESVGAFADALAAHSERENRTVYAWLAARHIAE